MSICKAYDVAHVRFRVPDIAVMRRFLNDFGMIEADATADRLYMRGHGGAPFLHVCELGEKAAFVGFGIRLRSIEDLESLAEQEGAPIEELDGPGGGKVVRLNDPDGNVVEAIAGQIFTDPIPGPLHQPWNQGGSYPRQGKVRRVPKGASHVQRLGHVVLGVGDFRTSEAWYKDRFGFITSDEIQPAPDVAIGAFMRADRGEEPCDHHTLFLLKRPVPPGFMHAAYEVIDMDDLMAGHDHLQKQGYRPHWGIGRHHLGSQVFDYWLDPYGNEIEHWTDGDQLVTADGGGIASVGQLVGVQWGMEMPSLPDADGTY
ncbi:VOC family protein [Novosphingobium resinovorum]|uniref:VOC family protein n=1 Tax=Novosphingobium resinovorum TaxID=158500 RepID=UPI002ED4AF70|nr:VOC family protein [Novosphingobium resinovorum]